MNSTQQTLEAELTKLGSEGCHENHDKNHAEQSCSPTHLDTFSNAKTVDENDVDAKTGLPPIQELEYAKMMKNVLLLSLCWALGIAAVFIQISTTTFAATDFSSSKNATIPLGALLCCATIAVVLIPGYIYRSGARSTFIFGAVLGLIGALINVWSTSNGSFFLLTFGAICQSFMYGCTNNFRFAVIGFSTPEFQPKAIALVVLGGTLAVVLGPELARHTRTSLDDEYMGSYFVLVGIFVALLMTLLLIDFDEAPRRLKVVVDSAIRGGQTPRPTKEVVANLNFVTIVFISACCYSAMGALMSGTPIAMKIDGHDFDDSTLAIQMHMLGMFIPSLFSGRLVQQVGSNIMCIVGYCILLLGDFLFFLGDSVAIYCVAIAVVGIGWNFAFVSATSQASKLFRPSERIGVLGCYEFFVIGTLAIAMISTSYLIDDFGWDSFLWIFAVYIMLGLLVCILKTVCDCRD